MTPQHTHYRWPSRLLLSCSVCLFAVCAIAQQDNLSTAHCDNDEALQAIGPWDSAEIGNFSDRLIIMLDATGGVFNGVKAMSAQQWEGGSRSELAWENYLEPLINERLPAWIKTHYPKGLEQVEFNAFWDNAANFSHGFPISEAGSWQSGFFQYFGQGDALEQMFRKFNFNNVGITKGFAVVSASAPMMVEFLSRCPKSAPKNFYRSLYLINISDNESNLAKGGKTGEIATLLENNTNITGYDFLANTRDKVYEYYSLLPISYAYFGPTYSQEQVYLVDDDAYKKVLDKKCRNDIGCDKALSASLTEVRPAQPLSSDDLPLLDRVPLFEYEADGYRMQVNISQAEVAVESVSASPYQLKTLCARPKPVEGYQEAWQCIAANNGNEWQFNWHWQTDWSWLPNNPGKQPYPESLEVVGLYRYSPPGLDFGLLTGYTQSHKLIYQPPGLLKNETRINRNVMRRYSYLSMNEVIREENEKIDAARLKREYLINAAIATAVMLLAVLVFWIFSRHRSRFRKPKPVLYIDAELPEPGSAELFSQESLVELRQARLSLDETLVQPEILVGFVRLENQAGTNRQGKWQEVDIDTLKVGVIRTAPEVHIADSPLLIGDSENHRDIVLRSALQWPLIFNVNHLELRKTLFPESSITLEAEIYVKFATAKIDQKTITQSISIKVEISPAHYDYQVLPDQSGFGLIKSLPDASSSNLDTKEEMA